MHSGVTHERCADFRHGKKKETGRIYNSATPYGQAVQSTPFTMFTICSPVSTRRQVDRFSLSLIQTQCRQVDRLRFSLSLIQTQCRQVDRFSLSLIQTQCRQVKVFFKSHTNAMSTGRQVKVFSKSHTNAMSTGRQVFFKSHTNTMSTG